MSVWVDNAMIPAKVRQHASSWSHLTADTKDELHAFAERLGLRRSYFQDHPRLWHYDLTAGKRAQALALGAESVDVVAGVRRALARPAATPHVVEEEG